MIASKKSPKISMNLCSVLLLVVISFGIYANTLQNDFVWDDTTLFVENYDIWQWKNLKQLLTSQDNLFGDNNNGYYRPLTNLTFLLDRYIWGHNAFGYHLTNIIFHILSTITIFFIAKTLSGRLSAAILSGLIFAIHPIHTEVVAWINGRNNVIATLFYLLAFYFYIRHRNHRNTTFFIISLISFACSLFSKEYALTFPIILVLYEISMFPETTLLKKYIKQKVLLWLPYFIILTGYLAIRSIVLPAVSTIDLQLDMLWVRLLSVPKITLIYFKLMAFPFNLNIFHNVSLIEHIGDPEFILQLFVFIILLVLWAWSFKNSKIYFFCFGWIWVNLIMVVNIIPIPYVDSLIAERYLYLPSAGFSMLIALAFAHFYGFSKKNPQRIRIYAAIFSFMVLFEIYGFETLKRNLVWRNELTLWQDTNEKSPCNVKVLCNLSIALHGAGRKDEALKTIGQAVRLNPDHDTPYFIMGYILYEKGLFEPSAVFLQKALEINPDHEDALNLITNINLLKKKRKKDT